MNQYEKDILSFKVLICEMQLICMNIKNPEHAKQAAARLDALSEIEKSFSDLATRYNNATVIIRKLQKVGLNLYATNEALKFQLKNLDEFNRLKQNLKTADNATNQKYRRA